MKRALVIGLFFTASVTAQELIVDSVKTEKKEIKRTYRRVDLSFPFRDDPKRGQIDPVTGEEGFCWCLPDGVSARYAAGLNFKDLIRIGISTGIDWRAHYRLVTVPVFPELRFHPKIGDDVRLNFAYGLGYAFAIGRGDLSGDCQKISIGGADDKGNGAFLEFSFYNFSFEDRQRIFNISLGISGSF